MNGLHGFKPLLLFQIILSAIFYPIVCLTKNQQQGGLYGNEENFID